MNKSLSKGQNNRTTSAEVSVAEPFLPAPAYTMPIDRLLSAAGGVSGGQGLSTEEVEKRRQQFGSNQIAEAAPVPTWRKLVAQFKDLVIWILIVAAIIAGGRMG